jgi:hypothetical protein
MEWNSSEKKNGMELYSTGLNAMRVQQSRLEEAGWTVESSQINTTEDQTVEFNSIGIVSTV